MGRVPMSLRGIRLCPECSGMGQKRMLVTGVRDGHAFTGWRDVHCTLCDGRGEIDGRKQQDVERGRMMREDRKARGLTLVEEALRLGISPRLLSRKEWGRG